MRLLILRIWLAWMDHRTPHSSYNTTRLLLNCFYYQVRELTLQCTNDAILSLSPI